MNAPLIPDPDSPVRGLIQAIAICESEGLVPDDPEYGPWLSPDRTYGVGIARIGDTFCGAGVHVVRDWEAERSDELCQINPPCPASLFRTAIRAAAAIVAREREEGRRG